MPQSKFDANAMAGVQMDAAAKADSQMLANFSNAASGAQTPAAIGKPGFPVGPIGTMAESIQQNI